MFVVIPMPILRMVSQSYPTKLQGELFYQGQSPLLLMSKRIAWGITGAGDKIEEIISVVEQIRKDLDIRIDVFLSKAGTQVLHWYKLWDRLNTSFEKVKVEVDANVPFIAGPLQVGTYAVLLVAPLSANSAAKIAHGIEDTLLTNAVAQALKGGTPVLVYPVDQFPGIVETAAPDGKIVQIKTREIDLRNVKARREMDGLTVLNSVESIRGHISSILSQG
jgi:archaeoflavoprotein AfpA